jgi:hypothetical protein
LHQRNAVCVDALLQDLNLNKGDWVVVDAKKKEVGAGPIPVTFSSGSDSGDSEGEGGLKMESGEAQKQERGSQLALHGSLVVSASSVCVSVEENGRNFWRYYMSYFVSALRAGQIHPTATAPAG